MPVRFRSLSGRSRESAYRRSLRFEGLEGRSLLATFSVITSEDGGPGSLRQAVIDANANPGPDVIELAGGLHVLAIPEGEEDTTATGDLDITDDVIINGNGSGIYSATDRIFEIHGARVVLEGLDISGSAGEGGGIYNDGGDLTTIRCFFGSNRAFGDASSPHRGGAVHSRGGSLTVVESHFDENVASVFGGVSGLAEGGAIYAEDATVTILASNFIRNRVAGHNAGGGVISTVNSSVSINNSRLEVNWVSVTASSSLITSGGGAIRASGGVVDIVGTQVMFNDVLRDTGTRFTAGGAIYVENAQLSLTNSLLDTNTVQLRFAAGGTASGGGIHAENASVRVVNSDIAGNVARNRNGVAQGGAVAAVNTQLDIVNSTLGFNVARSEKNGSVPGNALGGAIYVDGGDTRITSTQIVGNTAEALNGHNGFGGGVYIASGVAILANCDVVFNSAVASPGGTGIGGGLYIAGGTVTIKKSTDIEENFDSSDSEFDNIFADS
jgi:hypothetical protein